MSGGAGRPEDSNPFLVCPNDPDHQVIGYLGQTAHPCMSCALRGSHVMMTPAGATAGDPARGLVRGSELDDLTIARLSTGFPSLDRLLGGGLGVGASYCCAGEPGIGKSTLATQIAATVTPCLYVAGEEGVFGLRERATRIGALPHELLICSETRLDVILRYLDELDDLRLVVVDSLQSLHSIDVASRPGSPSQLVACAQAIHQAAHDLGITAWLLCHVTKDGDQAGPKGVEHLVDCTLHAVGPSREQEGTWRGIEIVKNRLGPSPARGVFGLEPSGAWSDAETRPRSTSVSA